MHNMAPVALCFQNECSCSARSYITVWKLGHCHGLLGCCHKQWEGQRVWQCTQESLQVLVSRQRGAGFEHRGGYNRTFWERKWEHIGGRRGGSNGSHRDARRVLCREVSAVSAGCGAQCGKTCMLFSTPLLVLVSLLNGAIPGGAAREVQSGDTWDGASAHGGRGEWHCPVPGVLWAENSFGQSWAPNFIPSFWNFPTPFLTSDVRHQRGWHVSEETQRWSSMQPGAVCRDIGLPPTDCLACLQTA